MSQPGLSPGTKFNLKNILGTNPPPTMQSGRRVPNGANAREKCCFCFDLRVGIFTITCVYITLYLISVANMISNSLGWQMRPKGWQGFDIFCVVVGLPLCVVGLIGAIKKIPKMVYAYFLYYVLYTVVTFLAAIAMLVEISRGKESKAFMEKCMNDPGLDYDTCKNAAKTTLIITTVFNLIFALFQVYWTYATRRFYLNILLQNAGHFSSYMQV